MVENQKVPPLKNRAVLLAPLVLLNVVENEAHIKPFFSRHLVFFLDLAHDAYQVEQGVLDLIADLHRSTKILSEQLLHERIASVIEFLEKLLDEVLGQQID